MERKDYEAMSDQTATAARADGELRAAVQAVLEQDLSDQELVARLRALLPPSEDTESPLTTDEATDHPGYQ
jgi:hypothetical protein